jgi:hypothetical protein
MYCLPSRRLRRGFLFGMTHPTRNVKARTVLKAISRIFTELGNNVRR